MFQIILISMPTRLAETLECWCRECQLKATFVDNFGYIYRHIMYNFVIWPELYEMESSLNFIIQHSGVSVCLPLPTLYVLLVWYIWSVLVRWRSYYTDHHLLHSLHHAEDQSAWSQNLPAGGDKTDPSDVQGFRFGVNRDNRSIS